MYFVGIAGGGLRSPSCFVFLSLVRFPLCLLLFLVSYFVGTAGGGLRSSSCFVLLLSSVRFLFVLVLVRFVPRFWYCHVLRTCETLEDQVVVTDVLRTNRDLQRCRRSCSR